MNIDELIGQALLDTHADDLKVIRSYVHWLRLRRTVNQIFFAPPIKRVHWAKPIETVHWIGRGF